MQTKTNLQQHKKPHLPSDLAKVERFAPNKDCGLTEEQVFQRNLGGFVNFDNSKRGKSVFGIICSNIFTFFNFIYFVITAILLMADLMEQCSYVPVVVVNSLIAMVQEIKSKVTLDKLNLVNEPQVKTLRDGKVQSVPSREVVLDDVIVISSGEQICADSVVLDGVVEVNESILTGESDAVVKNVGDTLFAGSYVVSGNCTAQVNAVGKYNYVSKLTGRAKQYQKPRSQMLKALHGILIFVAVVIVPMTLGLFLVNAQANNALTWSGWQFTVVSKEALQESLSTTAGSIISMIPSGPFLLTSIALAASFLRLAKGKTMVQELYCIEMLARVDTLCLDKTGTITDGTMRVVESIDLRTSNSTYTIREIMSSMNTALNAENATGRALKKFFGAPKKTALEPVTVLPFSSQRKLSAVSFKNNGTYILGAPEFVLKTPNDRVTDLLNKYASEGLRVLCLAQSSTAIYNNDTLPQTRRPIAIIVIEDHIREDAEDTISWFKQNDVAIKIISGDNPMTVSNIAMRVGVPDADKFVSLEGMTDEQVRKVACEYTVFGRVTPDQKAILVKALRSQGHTVAMTGDGVNDILAMKEADCSISLAGGSDAARQVSHLILMDDSFANLPKVVAEGRRVVNNIQSATSMYFMKTLYVIVTNVMLIVLHFAFGRTMPSPLKNLQLMLIDWFVVALPTTFLALQPNESRIRGRFFGNVIKRCLPASFTFIVTTVSLYVMHSLDSTLVPINQLGTLVTLSYTFGGLFALYYACQPLNAWRKLLYLFTWTIILVCLVVPFFYSTFFQYATLGREQLLLLLVEILASPFILYAFRSLAYGKEKKIAYKLNK